MWGKIAETAAVCSILATCKGILHFLTWRWEKNYSAHCHNFQCRALQRTVNGFYNEITFGLVKDGCLDFLILFARLRPETLERCENFCRMQYSKFGKVWKNTVKIECPHVKQLKVLLDLYRRMNWDREKEIINTLAMKTTGWARFHFPPML